MGNNLFLIIREGLGDQHLVIWEHLVTQSLPYQDLYLSPCSCLKQLFVSQVISSEFSIMFKIKTGGQHKLWVKSLSKFVQKYLPSSFTKGEATTKIKKQKNINKIV